MAGNMSSANPHLSAVGCPRGLGLRLLLPATVPCAGVTCVLQVELEVESTCQQTLRARTLPRPVAGSSRRHSGRVQRDDSAIVCLQPPEVSFPSADRDWEDKELVHGPSANVGAVRKKKKKGDSQSSLFFTEEGGGGRW